MAEIYGVKITNLKTFMGMEGPASQGNIGLNGKLLGFWSQDPNGGITDRYDFDITPLMGPAKKLFDSKPEDWEFRHLYEKEDGTISESFVDNLLYELTCLMDEEKEWKKMAKKGYPVMVVFHEAPDPKYPNAVPLSHTIFFREKAAGLPTDDIIRQYLEKEAKNEVIVEKVYKGPDDFIVK